MAYNYNLLYECGCISPDLETCVSDLGPEHKPMLKRKQRAWGK